MATIMASSTTALSRRAVRAAVRTEFVPEEASAKHSYANAVKGIPPSSRHPVPAPRLSRRQVPQATAAPAALSPAAPLAQATVDQLVANLLLTMQAIGTLLPAAHPLRAICLQAAAVQTATTQHG